MEWRPPKASFLTVSGVAATRVSPGRVSAGMPMFMEFSLALFWCGRPERTADDTRACGPLTTRARAPPPYNRSGANIKAHRGEIMTVHVRRVVTGHDGKGRAVV